MNDAFDEIHKRYWRAAPGPSAPRQVSSEIPKTGGSTIPTWSPPLDIEAVPTTVIDAATLQYGATLARPMSDAQARAIIAGIDENRVEGIAHIIVVRSTVAGRYDVHCLIDELDTGRAIAAIDIAKTQLGRLHQVTPTAPAAPSAHVALRMRAEALVDDIRMLQRGTLSAFPDFDLKREQAIAMVISALRGETT